MNSVPANVPGFVTHQSAWVNPAACGAVGMGYGVQALQVGAGIAIYGKAHNLRVTFVCSGKGTKIMGAPAALVSARALPKGGTA